MDKWIVRLLNELIDGQLINWIDGQIDQWTNGQTDG